MSDTYPSGVRRIVSPLETYHVTVPEKTGDLYVDLRFCSGFAHERPGMSGITHLLEHYLIGRAYRRAPEPLKVRGQVSDGTMCFALTTNARHAVRDARLFFDALLQPSFDDAEVFESERQAMRNELATRLNNSSTKVYELAGQVRFSGWCPYYIHYREEHDCVSRFTLSDIAQWYRDVSSHTRCVISVGADEGRARTAREVIALASTFSHSRGAGNLPLPACLYSSRSITCREDTTFSGTYVAVTFPALPSSAPLSDRLALRALCRLLTGGSSDGLFKDARSRGIYDVGFQFYANHRAGVLAFRAHVEPRAVSDLLGILRDAFVRFTTTLPRRSHTDDVLRAFRREAREQWRHNGSRLDWIIDALLDDTVPRGPREFFTALREASPQSVRRAAQAVLRAELVNIVALGDVSGVTVSDIDRVMQF